MRYQKLLWIGCGLLVVSLLQAQIRDDYSTVVAQINTPKFIVTYSDGAQEIYQPEWRAILTVHREATGHVAKPLQGDFIDTRACQWTIQGQVERSLWLCTRSGCTAKIEPSDAIATPSVVITLEPIHREPPPLKDRILRLAPDLCGDTHDQFRSDVETQRAQLIERFQQQVATGKQELAAQLAQLPAAQSVAEKPER